ncbi:excinuclease ABC subunit UvrA [Anaerosporobacter faecicola]|uniref:excinuclease ABC subunit UvrA n=1 Tax=Anaerosporobacter faecicola TaxID=2718714 RepID=UPI0014397CBD|nr:excinuclease ABC subunit UvrA [Anaerosporobacter faecicola]
MEEIKIQGAQIHNLKNISLSIPKHKLIVITGISGSGKSSLAFDILFEEGKNQYLRSIGILAGLEQEKRFESIDGIGPAVAIKQNTIRQSNPRSTVGTKTNLLNQLALVYATDGQTGEEGDHLSPSDFLYTTADGMCMECQGKGSFFDVNLEQLVKDQTTTLCEVYESLKVTAGFFRILRKKFQAYMDEPFWQLPEDIREEVVYGCYENGKQSYCIERILRNAYEKGEDVESVYAKKICPVCQGERITEEASEVLLHGRRFGELGQMTLDSLLEFLRGIPKEELSQFSVNVIKNVNLKLQQLIQFRLGHLSLYREMATLSGGEMQRVFLHQHLESKMDSLLYVFDEPMAGLHPSEKAYMIKAVKELRDLGNTVIVVEHDREMIKQADHIIEIGPGAGVEGGSVVYQGPYEEYRKADTILSQYLSGKRKMPERTSGKQKVDFSKYLTLEHANTHYLKDLTVEFPLHAMVGVAGLSGSGKSSLIQDTLLKRLATQKKYGHAEGLKGASNISGFAQISQEPIGRSSSSTPASYIGIWDKIRELFAKQPEAQIAHMSAGHFSFHSKGACLACGGSGYEKIFLTSDFSVDKICPVCHGMRFHEDTLAVTYREKNIADILAMSIEEAYDFFADQSAIRKPLRILKQMGMGYLTLGQPTSSLSGGEAQRVKLAKELGKQRGGNMLYILDEPTTGLSLYDTALLLNLLDQLVTSGNSVIVIEHNVEVLRRCDYIIELGPEGGDKGGEILGVGTPMELMQRQNSKIGRYLA